MDRMTELQVFGMEVETVRRLAIEGIAHDGTVHAIGVGGMDTELVGAAGLGVVVDEGSSFIRGRQTVIPLVKGVGGCFAG
jgi:hypothetical protein